MAKQAAAPSRPDGLTPSDVSSLKASFIPLDLAERAGVCRVDNADGAAAVGRKPSASADYSGLLFPYCWPGQSQPSLKRLRRDNPDLELQPDGTTKERNKYLTVAQSHNALYFPPGTDPAWLKDASIPAIFVEGEKKVLALSRFFTERGEKMLAIGLPGVWGWRGVTGYTTNGAGKRQAVKGPLPSFAKIEWTGREVEIVFDTDASANGEVQKARLRLAKHLTSLGAVVRILEMPDYASTGAKGIDDLLFIKGPGFVADWLAESRRKGTPVSATARAEGLEFRVEADGVYAVVEDARTGLSKPVFVCSRLDIVADSCDETGCNWGRLLRWQDRAGNHHQWALPMSLLKGEGEYRAELLDRGLTIGSSRQAKVLLEAYLNTKASRRVRSVSQIGWHRGAFVLPDKTIGPPDGEEIYLQTTHPNPLIKTSGTLEGWQTEVARNCVGNSRLLLAVSAAFAAPLLEPLNGESGGIHFHGGTSVGKTTLALTAGSVWGGSAKGFLHRWRATGNGLEAVAAAHNDCLLALDELAEVDPREAGETAYCLANEQGRLRMTKTIGLRPALQWRLLFLSTGEITLADHVATAGKRTRGGQEVRLLDLPANAGRGLGVFENLHGFKDGDHLARHLKEAALEHYGHPIRAFLQRLVTEREAVQAEWRTRAEAFRKDNLPSGASGEIIRAANRFALIGYAGELASEFGVTGWPESAALAAAAALFKLWLSNRGKGGTDQQRMLQQVRLFIEQFGQTRFQRIQQSLNSTDEEAQRVFGPMAGFVKPALDGEISHYYVSPEIWRAEVCKGFDAATVAKALEERGWLDTDAGKLLKTVRVLNTTRKLYAVKAEILEGSEL